MWQDALTASTSPYFRPVDISYVLLQHMSASSLRPANLRRFNGASEKRKATAPRAFQASLGRGSPNSGAARRAPERKRTCPSYTARLCKKRHTEFGTGGAAVDAERLTPCLPERTPNRTAILYGAERRKRMTLRPLLSVHIMSMHITEHTPPSFPIHQSRSACMTASGKSAPEGETEHGAPLLSHLLLDSRGAHWSCFGCGVGRWCHSQRW